MDREEACLHLLSGCALNCQNDRCSVQCFMQKTLLQMMKSVLMADEKLRFDCSNDVVATKVVHRSSPLGLRVMEP